MRITCRQGVGTGELSADQFSSPLLGKVFDLLRQRSAQGLSLQLPLLAASLTEEEMSHLAQVVSQPQSLANSEQALRDYIAVIRKESLRQREHTDDELLLAMQKKNLEKKAYMEDKQ